VRHSRRPVGRADCFQVRHLRIHSQGCPNVTACLRPLVGDRGKSSRWKRLVPFGIGGALRCRIVTRHPRPAAVERYADGESKGVRASPEVRWGTFALAISARASGVNDRHHGDVSSGVTETRCRGVRPPPLGTCEALHLLSPTVPGLVLPHHGCARHSPSETIRWGADISVCERHFDACEI
jgi:hypothetical protein